VFNLKTKVGMVSLGCPKNLVDSEIMLGMLEKNDFEITNDKKNADVLIVNTCGFIDKAKQESISTILEMAECKKDKCRLLVVTGCLVERYKDEIASSMPEVDAVIGTGNVGEIVDIINKSLKGDKSVSCGNLEALDYLENNRVISTPKGYAYLKIAEGCDNHCSYCVIPSIRGRYRSRKIEDIVKEAETLSLGGVKELILIAQDTTRYGTDRYGKKCWRSF
jgi:ribosomal protein S12 methylthiotransferase